MSNENNDKEVCKVLTVLTEAEVKTIEKALGEEICKGMMSMTPEELNKKIVECTLNKQQAKNEMKANEKYQQAQNTLSYFNGGLRDANKRQDQIVKYAFHVLEGKGKV